MGKKYLETKETSLESSILGVWAEAAKKTESVDIDEGTILVVDPKTQKVTKIDEKDWPKYEKKGYVQAEGNELDEATGKEIAAKMMKDTSMKSFASKVAKMKAVSRDDLEKMLPDYVDGGAITKLFKEDSDKGEPGTQGDNKEWQAARAKVLKKFGVKSCAALPTDAEKKECFKALDDAHVADHEESVEESFEFGTPEYRDHTLNVTPGETDPEWVRARDFKVASMKEALAKVWGFDEKVLDKSSKEGYDEEDEELKPVPGSKTMTGGKVAKVDTKPKID